MEAHEAEQSKDRLAILAGGGSMPVEVAHSAKRSGQSVLVIDLASESDLTDLDASIPRNHIQWGQVGRLTKLLNGHQTDKLVIIGSISKRPDYSSVRPDWAGIQMLPRLVTTLLAGGDASVLDKVAGLVADWGFTLVGAHEVAPDLVAQPGHIAGPQATDALREDIKLAAKAAWTSGHLDMGQGAIAVSGRLVAMEGAEGTDGMVQRVGTMRNAGRFSSKGKVGALAKCTRPQQDLRLDMPAIGPRTIENVAAAGLAGVVVEAGRVLIGEREETIRRCAKLNVCLVAEARETFVPEDSQDVPA
ncbi:MAG: LpxI family protein [Devosiaceae bacterium]